MDSVASGAANLASGADLVPAPVGIQPIDASTTIGDRRKE